ncbi:unnamed protein product, partial [Gongylonema pulchrum]|uniref:CG057 n=1 Tax=Gongylonema pulchrum TaxID=637853 RepID=A0A183ES79_9BILA
ADDAKRRTATAVAPISESISAVDIRQLEALTNGAQSPIKKISAFPDPPPSFILSKLDAFYFSADDAKRRTATVVAPISESISAVDIRQLEALANGVQSPIKKISAFPDPPPSFILNKEKAVEYDKDGRLHYIPKSISRSGSRDRQDDGGGLASESQSTTFDDEDTSFRQLHSRTNSTELARGTQPSVRLMAKAFETMETSTSKNTRSLKRSLFGIRKSRSVETTETGKSVGSAAKS